ncbi:helix-turn-helix domain-containing protein [Archangium lipolyticum]|uniref:helix-turn-helix domain-containing protein n=1 Tax=Archangium lipolyticum TaxID=2970465 RepID=UPI00214A06FE|nr:helix-turn-helix domain-containing protein [Archangium lipolyticum]
MLAPGSRVQVVRQESPSGGWMLALGQPAPRLAGYVRDYCGYFEKTPHPLRRRELSAPQVVLIIDFGPPLHLLDARDGSLAARHTAGFVAGLHETYSLTETPGAMSGLQVNFTPLGARLFFGLPMDELAHRVVGLEDVMGAEGSLLREQLLGLPEWEARFDLLDRVIATRIHATRAVPEWVDWAVRRLVETGGRVEAGALADELGYSHKHVIARFREHVGVPPKLFSRICRFEGAIRQLKAGATPDWGSLALSLGYYDQAHFIREFRQFTGSSPGEFLRQRMADPDGMMR